MTALYATFYQNIRMAVETKNFESLESIFQVMLSFKWLGTVGFYGHSNVGIKFCVSGNAHTREDKCVI